MTHDLQCRSAFRRRRWERVAALCLLSVVLAGCGGTKPLGITVPDKQPLPSDSVLLVLPQVNAKAGDEFDVPLRVEGAKKLAAFQGTFSFVRSTPGAPLPFLVSATPVLQGFTGTAPQPSDVILDANEETGKVQFVVVTQTGVTGDGTLLTARFRLPSGAPTGAFYRLELGGIGVADATLGNPKPLYARLSPGGLTVQ
jgi:hypothetical protein